MARARTLDEARKRLDPRPLTFTTDGDPDSDQRFYRALPPLRTKGQRALPGPVEQIRQRLLGGPRDTKMFLSGHVGSGKSTELNRLAADPEILAELSVVMLRFEEQEWATLDSSQILFRIAGAIHAQFKHLLKDEGGSLQKVLRELEARLFEKTGLGAPAGVGRVELDVLVAKLVQELKLNDGARRAFRAFGETQQSLVQEVLQTMVSAVEAALADAGAPRQLLVLADDMDKVRGAEQQQEIFDKNLAALIAPPLRVVYTLPTGVLFGESLAELRQNVEQLYPVRILRKAPDTFDPDKAYSAERIGFFEELLHLRIEEGLITPEAIRLAAIYAGGVLRDFFHLLREGIRLARYNQLEVLDEEMMRYAVDEARLRESAGLYAADYEALALVHRTNGLRTEADRRYLDTSRVLSCHDETIWFEAAPLLWKLLEEKTGAAPPEAVAPRPEAIEPSAGPVHRLEIVGVGPAESTRIDFASRLNLLAGDNSAGKTFVIDVLWWALTGTWSGSPAWARPRDKGNVPPSITLASGERRDESEYDALHTSWPPLRRGPTPTLAIYARVDGGFSVWDPLRCTGTLAEGYHFGRDELWKGLTVDGLIVCNGLIADVQDWYTRKTSECALLQSVLTELSPPGESMKLGAPIQLPTPEERWYPTLDLSYGPVPVVHASAAVKRVLGLAYLLVWAFQGHRRAAEERGRRMALSLTLLIDELEAHLHPKWQRRVAPALLRAVDLLSEKLPVQVFVSTHAPLILASLEPHFDSERDSLLHFEIKDDTVRVRPLLWTTHGDATNWLESSVFGLPWARSPEAGQAIDAALAFRRGEPLPGFETEESISSELRRTLPGDDEFFHHWFLERPSR